MRKKDGLPVKIHRINYNGKKLNHGHIVGYYNIEKGDTLHLVGRLRGGAKRKAATMAEETLSKEDKINVKVAELQLTLIQLGNLKNAFAHPSAKHIELALEQGKTLIDETLCHISVANLQQALNKCYFKQLGN
ncbi:MAG: ubiquitin-like protein, partial [Candidatus Fonsibacter sp.]